MSNETRSSALTRQIELRLTVLDDWWANGVPAGKQIPTSLNRVRVWQDDSLSLEKIGSPSSFTRTHRQHGNSVCHIAELLEKLNQQKKDVLPKRSCKVLLANERKRVVKYKDALTSSANQYASISVSLGETERNLRIAAQSLLSTENELASTKQEMVRLRSELAKHRAQGSGTNITSLDIQNRSHAK